ncbi:MAG: polysaccharide deacetylase family protein [Solirubrobacteraceae bacterium]
MLVGGGLIGAALLAHALPALAQPWTPLRRPLGVEDRTPLADSVALTFDDGPHPHATPAVLELLAEAGASATFFLVGEQVRRFPALAQEIAAAGHEVALHCDRHRNLLRVGPRATRVDLERALEAIADASGVAPRLYRPPYGVFNAAALIEARRRGWQPQLWTRWGRDWEARARPEQIVARLTEGVTEGDVLVLHDADWYAAPESWRRTLGALPGVLEAIAAAGLRCAAVR